MEINLLLGYKCDEETRNEIIDCLKDYGVHVNKCKHLYLKRSLITELSEDKDSYDVLLTQQNLDNSGPFNEQDLDLIASINSKIQIIMIFDDKYKGTKIMQSACNAGIYDSIFMCDASLENIAELINKKRDRMQCKLYYGIQSESLVNMTENKSVFDEQNIYEYMCRDTSEHVEDKIAKLNENISDDILRELFSKLPQVIKNEIVATRYAYLLSNELFNESEQLPQNKKRVVKEKLVEKEKIIEKEKIVYRDRIIKNNEVIGICGVTEGAGSTFIALNLARQLAATGVEPTLLQLPGTYSDLFNSLNFMQVFGDNYISQMQIINDGGNLHGEKNVFEGINFVVTNPIVDNLDNWDLTKTYKLITELEAPIIIDFGCNCEVGNCELLGSLKHIVAVIDNTIYNSIGDIRYFKTVVRGTKAELGYVINKFNESDRENYAQVIGLMDNEYPYVRVPYFQNALNNSENLKQLSMLLNIAGFKDENNQDFDGSIRPIMKHRDSSMNEKLSPDVVIEIGVGGVCQGVGTTHTAIMVAQCLSKKYRVALFEHNNSGQFSNIGNYLNANKIVGNKQFTYAGVDVYYNCRYLDFILQCRDYYDFIVVDFGIDFKCEDFYRMNKKIIVASASPFKVMELCRYVEKETHDPMHTFIYAIPFYNGNQINDLRKVCGGSKVIAVPVCVDPFNTSEEITMLFTSAVINTRNNGRKLNIGSMFKMKHKY